MALSYSTVIVSTHTIFFIITINTSLPPGYLSLEGLLILFARLLPRVADRANRSNFINDVFFHEGFRYGKDITSILDSAPTVDWEITSMKIVEVLAKSRLSLYALDFIQLCA